VGNKTIEPLQTATITLIVTPNSGPSSVGAVGSDGNSTTYRVNGTSILPETYRTITNVNCNLPQLYTVALTSKMSQTELETHLTKVSH
jgi:hypothetical protein